MNPVSQARLARVHPELARRIAAMVEALALVGVHVEVVQGLRTFAEQEQLFAQGRTRPGPVVTKARGGQSNHNYGLACDVAPVRAGQIDWAAPAEIWTSIGGAAEAQGLEWGGRWQFVDLPHVQLCCGLTVGDSYLLYQRNGSAAVWRELDRRLRARS